jgi:hypothetical protein
MQTLPKRSTENGRLTGVVVFSACDVSRRPARVNNFETHDPGIY